MNEFNLDNWNCSDCLKRSAEEPCNAHFEVVGGDRVYLCCAAGVVTPQAFGAMTKKFEMEVA